MKKTSTIQANRKNLYINIPKKISDKMELKKGETALIEYIDKDTLKITIVEE